MAPQEDAQKLSNIGDEHVSSQAAPSTTQAACIWHAVTAADKAG